MTGADFIWADVVLKAAYNGVLVALHPSQQLLVNCLDVGQHGCQITRHCLLQTLLCQSAMSGKSCYDQGKKSSGAAFYAPDGDGNKLCWFIGMSVGTELLIIN